MAHLESVETSEKSNDPVDEKAESFSLCHLVPPRFTHLLTYSTHIIIIIIPLS